MSIVAWFKRFKRRRLDEEDLQEEIRAHLAIATQDRIAAGAALGIVAALGATRLLGSVLFGVSATDSVSFARALAVVFAGIVVATLVPSWRAARIDPLNALRHR
jgi:hypothetical protein